MQRRVTLCFLLIFALLVPPAYGQWAMKVEPNHSTVGFSIPIMGGITRVTGKFTKFKVDIVYDEEDITKSSVKVEIDVSSAITGIDVRDRDLQGKDFFDVANHPVITFQSRKIEKRGEGFVAIGDLTMRGVTREVELMFVFSDRKKNKDGRPRIGVVANAKLNRQDFGVGSDWVHSAIPNFIGDEVTIEIFASPGSARKSDSFV